MATNWSTARLRQLEKLRDLLIEAQAVNHGSGAVQRIQRIERMARALFTTNLASGRASFYQFLVDQAIKERIAKK
jgi:hypothetical protein